MNFGRCVNCDKLVSYSEYSICKDCYDKILKEVKEYTRENGSKSIKDMHKELGYPIKLFEYFYKKGDLVLTPEAKKEMEEQLNNLNKLKSMLKDSKDNSENKSKGSGFHSKIGR